MGRTGCGPFPTWDRDAGPLPDSLGPAGPGSGPRRLPGSGPHPLCFRLHRPAGPTLSPVCEMGTRANHSPSGPGRSWAVSSAPRGPVSLPGPGPCPLPRPSTERPSTGSHLETIVLVALKDIIKIYWVLCSFLSWAGPRLVMKPDRADVGMGRIRPPPPASRRSGGPGVQRDWTASCARCLLPRTCSPGGPAWPQLLPGLRHCLSSSLPASLPEAWA